jgi:hypothetical protein
MERGVMSRQLPAKPNLEFLRKQAKELLRTLPQGKPANAPPGKPANAPRGKLADAQRALAEEYGFASWADLKAHVQSLGLSPAEALKSAVCDSNAARVREVLRQHPELRAKIDDPMPGYGFGANALFAAVQRSDRATIDVLLQAGADIRKRTVSRAE